MYTWRTEATDAATVARFVYSILAALSGGNAPGWKSSGKAPRRSFGCQRRRCDRLRREQAGWHHVLNECTAEKSGSLMFASPRHEVAGHCASCDRRRPGGRTRARMEAAGGRSTAAEMEACPRLLSVQRLRVSCPSASPHDMST